MSRLPCLLPFLILAACQRVTPSGDESGTSGSDDSTGVTSTSSASSTGAASSSGDTSTSDPDPSTSFATDEGDSTTTGSSTSETSSSSASPTCGDGVVDDGEDCDDGQNGDNDDGCTDLCGGPACGDGFQQESLGEQCDLAVANDDHDSSCTKSCQDAVCGDGLQWNGVEECEDGNADPGDGCSAACEVERWSHEGVAHNIPVSGLYKWEPCWSDSYEAGELVSNLLDACIGDHILLGCRQFGVEILFIAAHAPRGDVFFEPQVNYDEGERHEANGVNWYYSPYFGQIGYAPVGNTSLCTDDGEDEQMCWRTAAGEPKKLSSGSRCGDVVVTSVEETMLWERVAFQSWD